MNRRAASSATHALCALTLTGLVLTACGGASGAGAANAHRPSIDASANAARLAKDESALLDDLALTDVRLARRFERTPSESDLGKRAVSSILAEDPEMRVVDGALDLFSFRARARALNAADAKLAAWTYPLNPEADLERELLKRLVREEKARATQEMGIPRSASELVRGVLATWIPPGSEDARDSRDAWLSGRLEDLAGSMKDGALSQLEKDELDDTLDALERLTAGYGKANAALAKLRLDIDKVHPAEKGDASRWRTLSATAALHLGFELDAKTLKRSLEETSAKLAVEIKRLRGALAEDDAHARELTAEAQVMVEERCPSGKRGSSPSGLRAYAPPPERAAVCGALLRVDAARGDAELLPAMMALHDDVMTALWAIAIHADLQTPDGASKRYRPASFFPPEREVRLLRRVAVRAAPTIVLGWAVVILARDLPSLRARASRWLALGDAPLDVIERHLAAPSP